MRSLGKWYTRKTWTAQESRLPSGNRELVTFSILNFNGPLGRPLLRRAGKERPEMSLIPSSIQKKQILVIIGTICATLLFSTVAFLTYDSLSFRGMMLERATLMADNIAKSCAPALRNYDLRTLDRTLEGLRNDPDVRLAFVLSKEGQVLCKYQTQRLPGNFGPPASANEGYRFYADRIALFHNISYKNLKVGALYLEMNIPSHTARLYGFVWVVLAILLFSVPAAWMISVRLQRALYAPILELARVSRKIAQEENYSIRVPVTTHDELGQLVENFNEMLIQIQIRDKALHQAGQDLEERVIERTKELELEVWERKHAEEMLRQQFSRLALLNQIARAVAARQDLPSIFQVTIQDLQTHLPLDFAAVYQLTPEKTQFVLTTCVPERVSATEDTEELLAKFDLPAPYSQTMKDGEMVSFETAAEMGCSLAINRIQAGLPKGWILPLSIEKQPFGILVVGRKDPKGFSLDEGKFLMMVREQAELAANQAQLYGQVQKAYEELRATQQAVLRQERLRALGQMASGIAHDINNALVPILGFTDLMLTSPNLKPGELKNLTCIKNASLDIVRTVERMREFYRHRQQNETLITVDLNKLVQDAVDLSRPRWRDIPQQRGIVVQLQQDPDPSLSLIRGIESEIRQALINLILNSVDAMPKGGTLTLKTQEIEKNHLNSQTKHWAVIDVIDTGIGMDEENRRRCLEPFFSTKDQRGTGLGLAMVYGVMERHEGHIEIESTVGKGTTVHLYFPIHGSPSAKKAEKILQASALKPPGLRILCIDDEISVLNVLNTVLKRLGHEVAATDRGLSGIEMLKKSVADQKPFDVVITDLGMPGMDGRAVAQAVKNESPATKVILLTGWGMFMDSNTENLPGIDHIMSKPCTMKDLQTALIIVRSQKAQL